MPRFEKDPEDDFLIECRLGDPAACIRMYIPAATRSIKLGKGKKLTAVAKRRTAAAPQPRAADRIARPWLCRGSPIVIPRCVEANAGEWPIQRAGSAPCSVHRNASFSDDSPAVHRAGGLRRGSVLGRLACPVSKSPIERHHLDCKPGLALGFSSPSPPLPSDVDHRCLPVCPAEFHTTDLVAGIEALPVHCSTNYPRWIVLRHHSNEESGTSPNKLHPATSSSTCNSSAKS